MPDIKNVRCITRRLRFFLFSAVLFSFAASADSGHNGTVKVLYAGSLAHVMRQSIRPAFEVGTNDAFEGFTAGSNKLASEIKSKIRRGDVFISAHPDVNKKLMGRANGDWIGWYATFIKSPLVLGYNPHGSFSRELEFKPWYEIITQSRIKVGRTDPKLDPKGRLTVNAANQIARKVNQPRLKQEILDNTKIYPENALVGRLQSGQIDAGFFYKGEAAAVGIPSVPITPVRIGAIYTITVLNRAPHKAAAADFVRFVLGDKGKRILEKNGFDVQKSIKISGDNAAISDALRPVLGAK